MPSVADAIRFGFALAAVYAVCAAARALAENVGSIVFHSRDACAEPGAPLHQHSRCASRDISDWIACPGVSCAASTLTTASVMGIVTPHRWAGRPTWTPS